MHALANAGYEFPRVAGTSAGAIVAAMVAALQKAGEPLTNLDELSEKLDFQQFADPSLIGRLPAIGPVLSLVVHQGIYRGDRLERILSELLAERGVRTFGDLRTGEEAVQYAWSLVVTAADLSRRRLVRIPWDLPSYGLDPDEFSVARAVRASASVVNFFQPVRVPSPAGVATWVDGGLLSNFPVSLFDRPSPRWPTFGIRLSGPPGIPPTRPVRNTWDLALAAAETLISDQDGAYVDDPCTLRRTIFVPVAGINSLKFNLTPAEREELYQNGVRAGEEFLATWDFAAYCAACRLPGECS